MTNLCTLKEEIDLMWHSIFNGFLMGSNQLKMLCHILPFNCNGQSFLSVLKLDTQDANFPRKRKHKSTSRVNLQFEHI